MLVTVGKLTRRAPVTGSFGIRVIVPGCHPGSKGCIFAGNEPSINDARA
jgi:hypothetical protein